MIYANCKKLNDLAIIPTKGSIDAAGYDLYAAIEEPITIAPYTVEKIGTGLAFSFPNTIFAGIYARSGWATNRGLRPANCVGVCDADYRGEYIVALYNDSSDDQVVNPGDRIAQLVFHNVPQVSILSFETELDETERGDGGFGSTGE